jgi:hypothetical protein
MVEKGVVLMKLRAGVILTIFELAQVALHGRRLGETLISFLPRAEANV